MARSLAPLMLFAAVAVPLLEGCKSPEGNLSVHTWPLTNYGNYGLSDRFGNIIEFINMYHSTFANFMCGTDVFKTLANSSHTSINAIIGKQVTMTEADFEVIGSWRDAKKIKFEDKSDFALQLVEHAHLLQKNGNLQSLTLNIQRGSFDQLKLAPLFAAYSGLKQLSLGVLAGGQLTDSELQAFHQRQIIPNEFEVKFHDGTFAITYTKRERAQLFHP